MNAFTQIEDAQIKEEAKELLKNEKAFHDRYGDGYVRGMQTGGEMFITISITSSTKETQQSIAAELKAAYGTKPARGEGKVAANVDLSNISSRCELRVSTYQRGGAGQEQALVETLENAIERLREFPTQVAANPVPYEVQVASYHTLPLPEGQSPTDIEERKEQLEKYARLQFKFVSLRNEIEFIQSHPGYFDGLPQPLSILNEWNEELTTTINELKRDAAKCANSEQKPSEIVSYENKLTTFKDKLSDIKRKTDFRLVNGREKNASLTVNINNLPTDLPGQNWKHSVIYKDFEATVKLATLFLDSKINSGRGIGLGIFSRANSKTIAILYIIYPAGTRTDVLWSGSGGPDGGDSAGGCSSDVIYLKIRKEDNKFEMFYSLDGMVWISRKQDDLTDPKYGFGADDPLDVVLTGYSMDGKAISGKFYNLSIEKIAK